MGRKKTNNYKLSIFAQRISELQEKYGYTDEYIISKLLDKNDEDTPYLINNLQTYQSYKSGKRKPRNFFSILIAFAEFYDVTIDYLVGIEDTPNHQVKAVQDVTGLSEAAIKRLQSLKDNSSGILEMIDAILSGTQEEDVVYFFNLYTQIYQDYYDDFKVDVNEFEYDRKLLSSQRRYETIQRLYDYCKRVVTPKLAPRFEKEILMEESYEQYISGEEFNMDNKE